MLNNLTMNSVLTDTKVKFTAIMMAIMVFFSVTVPSTVSAGDVGDLKPKFEGGKFNLSGGSFSSAGSSSDAVWQTLLSEFHIQISALFGVFMLFALLRFGILLSKFIGASDNPRERSEVQTGMVWAGLATAGLGGITLFFGFFYHLLL